MTEMVIERTAPPSGARLNFTLFFSVVIHLILILGIGFSVSSPPNNPPLTSLDITLVKQQTEEEPEKADFFAQANNVGSGDNHPEKTLDPTPNSQGQDVKTIKKTQAKPTPPPAVVPTPPKPVAESTKAITQAKAERKITTSTKSVDKTQPVDDITPPLPPQISASDLIVQAKNDIAELHQQLEMSAQALNSVKKKRRLSSNTKQYAAAAYHEAWRKKVERIGNMNYPAEAKKQRLNGSLMLSVDINPDGSVPVDGIVISRSSGHKLLDAAAIKIVRLAAPYAPIPEEVLQDHDVITIIRTWKFETDYGLQAR